jgi:isoquinoline 1-oxidoreductase beta subunit
MPPDTSLDRRDFLRAGGLLLGFVLGRPDAEAAGPTDFHPNAWLRIAHSGDVTVLIEKSDVGQGIWTTIAMLVAEELEADWRKIRVEQAPPDPKVYSHMSTGGSGGTIESYDDLRRAGAQAREMLLAAAAQTWSVAPAACKASAGQVTHTPTGRRLAYGDLAAKAAALPAPKLGEVQLKAPSEFRVIGASTPRHDIPSKVNGTAKFGIDVKVPGMLYAVVARCPTFGGKAVSFKADAAKAVAGVRAVVEIEPIGRPTNTSGGIAVVADNLWAAMKGRTALAPVWDRGPGGSESSESYRALAQTQLHGPATFVAREQGDVAAAEAGAARLIDVTYEQPFQPHAPMEPMNCVADARPDRIEIWTGTQWPLNLQSLLERISGLPAGSVVVHNQSSGGSFGRRGHWDYPAEAWQISKAVGKPVKLIWTREDDMEHDFFRPLSYHRMVAALDGRNTPTSWSHRVVSTSIREIFDSPEALKNPRQVARQELGCASEVGYTLPNMRVDYAPLKSVVPRCWWRSVESSFNCFAIECFVDELAVAAGKDPYTFRMELLPGDVTVPNPMWPDGPLSTKRYRAVLKAAAEKSDWGKPLPKGWGRGIAAYGGFGSYIAWVAEVSAEPDGGIRVRKVTGAVDCGRAVNPDGVKAMMEGACNFGLAATLTGEITIAEGAAVQTNFDGYRTLRMPDSPPVIDVHIIESGLRVGGMGEPGVPPIMPAVANAVFAATGKRVRRLPLLTAQGKLREA